MDRVFNSGPLAPESDVLPTAMHSSACSMSHSDLLETRPVSPANIHESRAVFSVRNLKF